jgi:outer membrane lipoprotein-sorting protein
MRKPFACFFALAMVFSLAACGGDTSVSAPAGPSIEDLLAQAQESMASVTSMRYTTTMDMDLAADGEAMQVLTTVKTDCILDPLTLKMDTTLDLGEWGDLTTESYVTTQGDTATVYTGMDVAGTGEMTWASQELSDLSYLSQYDAQSSFELYLSSAESFTEAGQETISGVACTRYDGTIAKDAIRQVLDASGVLDQLDTLELGDLSGLLDVLDDLPISIWLSQEDSTPMQYELEMTGLMQSMMDQLFADEDVNIEVNRVTVSLTMEEFNNLETLQIPEEALAS